jgi:hypothetical protein
LRGLFIALRGYHSHKQTSKILETKIFELAKILETKIFELAKILATNCKANEKQSGLSIADKPFLVA